VLLPHPASNTIAALTQSAIHMRGLIAISSCSTVG
jgi:hypothetical protein